MRIDQPNGNSPFSLSIVPVASTCIAQRNRSQFSGERRPEPLLEVGRIEFNRLATKWTQKSWKRCRRKYGSAARVHRGAKRRWFTRPRPPTTRSCSRHSKSSQSTQFQVSRLNVNGVQCEFYASKVIPLNWHCPTAILCFKRQYRPIFCRWLWLISCNLCGVDYFACLVIKIP